MAENTDAVDLLQSAKNGMIHNKDPGLQTVIISLSYQVWKSSVAKALASNLDNAIEIMRRLMTSESTLLDRARFWDNLELSARKDALYAFGLLESGRDIINRMLMEVRQDVAEIRKHAPDLAEKFIHLRDELEAPTNAAPQSLDSPTA